MVGHAEPVDLVRIEDIHVAAERIAGVALYTRLLPQPWVTNRRLWLKPENLQPAGTFKIRGVYNALAILDDVSPARGVVTYSSGNHAQAVAYAARLLGIPAIVVMQDDAPRIQVDKATAQGAEIVMAPMAERESFTYQVARERQLTVLPPFDHRDVIAGQGTVGLEVAVDVPDVEVVVVPVGGGGLASGIGVAIAAICPRASVYGVVLEFAGDTAHSFESGQRARWSDHQRARIDADDLRTEPSELTAAHMAKLLDGIITVTDEEVRATVRTLATRARLVAEPSGAVATAACLFHSAELPPGRTVAIVSGGNIDPGLLAEVVDSA